MGTKYQNLLDKRLEENTELLRIYINGQIEQFKGLNVITMRHNNIIAERMARVEEEVKKLLQRK